MGDGGIAQGSSTHCERFGVAAVVLNQVSGAPQHLPHCASQEAAPVCLLQREVDDIREWGQQQCDGDLIAFAQPKFSTSQPELHGHCSMGDDQRVGSASGCTGLGLSEHVGEEVAR